jgi:hypothetical protein
MAGEAAEVARFALENSAAAAAVHAARVRQTSTIACLPYSKLSTKMRWRCSAP